MVMIFRRAARVALVVAALPFSVLAGACATEDSVPGAALVEEGVRPQADPPEAASANADSPLTAIPTASRSLPNGNVLEFYENGIISEVGSAYTDPLFDPRRTKGADLVSIWRSFGDDVPVPPQLFELQTRLLSREHEPRSLRRPQFASDALLSKKNENPSADRQLRSARELWLSGQEAVTRFEGISSGGVPTPESWCGNGCCDSAWLDTLWQCYGHGNGYHEWRLQDYGLSIVNYSDIIQLNSVVCASVGTSVYRISASDGTFYYSVTQGTYRTFHWWYLDAHPSCFWPQDCDWDMMYTSVNQYSTYNTHTYCGFMGE